MLIIVRALKTRRQETVKISSRRKFSVRLIGTPFTLLDGTIDTRNDPCYQHLEFEAFQPGNYEFKMSINCRTNELKLDCSNGKRHAIFRAEVCYRVGQNCVLCSDPMEEILQRERDFMDALCGDDPSFVPDDSEKVDYRQFDSVQNVLQRSSISPGSVSSCTIEDDVENPGEERPASRKGRHHRLTCRRLDSSYRSISKLSSAGVSKRKRPVEERRQGTVNRNLTTASDDQLSAEGSSSASHSFSQQSHAITAQQALAVARAGQFGRKFTERRSMSVAGSVGSFNGRER